MAPLADGAVAAAQVGAVVFVVNPSTTRIEPARVALGNLEKANARVLGFIWNRVAKNSINDYTRYQKHCRTQSETSVSAPLAPNTNG